MKKGQAQSSEGNRLAGWWMKLSPAVRFVLSFMVSLLVLGSLYAFVTARYSDTSWLLDSTAAVVGWATSLISDAVSYSGCFVTYDGFTVEIIDECTGLFEMVIYLAAVVSFSTSVKKKLIGVAMGIPAIYLFNVVRIFVLLLAGAHSQELFKFMHLYFWQVTLILMIGTVWVVWLYLVVYRETKRTVAVSP